MSFRQFIEALLDPRHAIHARRRAGDVHEVRVHRLALEPVDECVARGVQDEPADVLSACARGVRCDVEGGVGGAVAKGVGDEPGLVAREGAAEGVEVVDALGEDGSADEAEEMTEEIEEASEDSEEAAEEERDAMVEVALAAAEEAAEEAAVRGGERLSATGS